MMSNTFRSLNMCIYHMIFQYLEPKLSMFVGPSAKQPIAHQPSAQPDLEFCIILPQAKSSSILASAPF